MEKEALMKRLLIADPVCWGLMGCSPEDCLSYVELIKEEAVEVLLFYFLRMRYSSIQRLISFSKLCRLFFVDINCLPTWYCDVSWERKG